MIRVLNSLFRFYGWFLRCREQARVRAAKTKRMQGKEF